MHFHRSVAAILVLETGDIDPSPAPGYFVRHDHASALEIVWHLAASLALYGLYCVYPVHEANDDNYSNFWGVLNFVIFGVQFQARPTHENFNLCAMSMCEVFKSRN